MTAPLLISRKNAFAVTGEQWSWCCRAAQRLGVPFVRVGRKRLLVASAFMEAVTRELGQGASESSAPEPESPEDAKRMLRERIVNAGRAA